MRAEVPFTIGRPIYNLDQSLAILYTEKKVEPKRLHPGAVLENGATLEGGASGGAELRTMKRLQGWSRFGSTFFLNVYH